MLRVDRRGILRSIRLLDEHARKFRSGCPRGTLSLVFLTDRELAELHDRHLGDPSVTDVITFSGEPSVGSAGELCVSADAARRQAPRNGPETFSRELALYVVHGWLHLAGYDDLAPARKRAMRRAETRAMNLLSRAGALPRFRWKRA